MDVLLFGSLGFCRGRQPRNRLGERRDAMTAINIRVVFCGSLPPAGLARE
jgi:hypothetical protein